MVTKKKTTKAKTAKKTDKKTDVYNIARKVGLFGIGVAAITKDKADALVKDLIKKGDLNKDEGKKLVAEIVEKSKKSTKDLETTVNRQVKDLLNKTDVATKKEIKVLEAKIKKLEADMKKQPKKK
ncbi:MAG: phasin family protein [Candidatus Aenigmarchaeota archaeon]|nr:phasin family protein [Candidatus Aenigmarchaeota archaeon]